MTPWLKQAGIKVTHVGDEFLFDVNTPVAKMTKSNGASEPLVCAVGGGRGKYHDAEADVPHCQVYQGLLVRRPMPNRRPPTRNLKN